MGIDGGQRPVCVKFTRKSAQAARADADGPANDSRDGHVRQRHPDGRAPAADDPRARPAAATGHADDTPGPIAAHAKRAAAPLLL